MSTRLENYTVAWICAVQPEYVVACELLDEIFDSVPRIPAEDHNTYTFGRIDEHHVVVACLPMGRYGTNSTAIVAERMRATFQAVRFGLLVGIAGGAPSDKHDIRLGDVVVSIPTKGTSGVIQYDYGKSLQNNEFEETGQLNSSPEILLGAVHKLATNHERKGHRLQDTIDKMLDENKRLQSKYHKPSEDRLYQPAYAHIEDICNCLDDHPDESLLVKREMRGEPVIHYGLVASANRVMKDSLLRDALLKKHKEILCFEMEAAGLMNNFPCLVIRGICDYSDSHKNDSWQGYAAGIAAAYAKELLSSIPAAEIKLMSLMMLPYPRDNQFVGREEELKRLEIDFNQKSSTHQLRNVLVGMGGVGKSQIAIEHAYRLRESNPNHSIFWVFASDMARFEQGYLDIASRVGFTVPDMSKVLEDVYRWLSDEFKGTWTMIIDNLDNDELLVTPCHNGKTLRDFIPTTSNGSILTTTRNHAAASLLTDDKHILPIDIMDKATSLKLLRMDGLVAEALVEALQYLPIAIVHAGAYIRNRQWDASRYLQLFQNEKTKYRLLDDKSVPDARRDASTSPVVMATWDMSFSCVREDHPRAADLFSLLSIYDHHKIPRILMLQDGPDQDEAEMDLDDDLAVLARYCLLTRNSDLSCRIHHLVQTAMVYSLKKSQTWQFWFDQSATIVADKFPEAGVNTWSLCQVLLSHGLKILKGPSTSDNEIVVATVTRCVALYLWELGDPGLAAKLLKTALEVFGRRLGSEDIKTLRTTIELANATIQGGRVWPAIEMLEEILPKLSIYRDGPMFDARTYCARILLQASRRTGNTIRIQEAKERLLEIIDAEDELGKDDINLLSSKLDLAEAGLHLGEFIIDFDMAEKYLHECLEGYEKHYGSENMDYILAENDLAVLAVKRGRTAEAVASFRKIVDTALRILPEGHPRTYFFKKGLAEALREDRQYETALSVFSEVVAMAERIHSPTYWDALFVRAEIAEVHCNLGQYETAESIAQAAMETCMKAYPGDQSKIMQFIDILAVAKEKQKKFQEVDALHEKFPILVHSVQSSLYDGTFDTKFPDIYDRGDFEARRQMVLGNSVEESTS